MVTATPVVPSLLLPPPSPRKDPVVATHRPCEIIPLDEDSGVRRARTARPAPHNTATPMPPTDLSITEGRMASPRMTSREQRTPVLVAYSKELHDKITRRPRKSWGDGPSPTGCFKFKRTPRKVTGGVDTGFRAFYGRSDMPFKMKHDGRKTLQWKVPPDTVDYSVVLPIFIDGLREVQPLSSLKGEGRSPAADLIEAYSSLEACSQQQRPQGHAKGALGHRVSCRRSAIEQALHLIQVMVKSGDEMDFGSKRNLGAMIEDTLTVLETHGGEDAFINIKYMIPTYESRVLN
ncbi:hypothetical protein FOZ60_004461 [Perkinsus olseni]|uniref:Uncharacterized protein n=1 Tax=Perkinsus olseni TaxID=32597 RepID=A0A7J6PN96_PEROL|nr:hypothetical protein FOZ60_004461 [Perkinsus olseni]